MIKDPRSKPKENLPIYVKSSKGEQACRDYLQSRFGMPFIKARPGWLINPYTYERMELDCYNSDLRLAVEYNGQQHYKFVQFFHKTYSTFTRQVGRDEMKKKICKDKGINLIIVPYNVKDIPKFLEERLRLLGY